MGQHAQRGADLSRDRAVDLGLSGRRHHDRRAGVQPDRRRPPGPLGPDAQQCDSSRAGGRLSAREPATQRRSRMTTMTRRRLLQAGGLTLGALALPRPVHAQTPKAGGTFVTARTTEATGLDPQLVSAFSRSARSPLMYNQLVRFEPDMTPVGELGTGPYVLEDWKVEQQMVLKKNPAYFKKGLPHVDQVILRVIPDEANIVAALRTGQIHHAFIEDNKNYNLLKDEKTLTGYRSSRLGYDYLNITATRGPLKDVRVRQAISCAVDRSQMMRVATAGFGRLTAPATAPMKQWQLPEEQWMRYYKPDLDKAKKLMADAGVASGFTVKCMVIPTFPTMVSGAPVIAAQLKRIGITMEIENVEYALWIKRWLAHDFDMTMNTTPGYADPDTAFFRALHSTKGQNWNSWSVPDLDAMLEEGRRTLDPKKRKEIYDRVQLMILENVPQLWLFSADTIDFTQTAVKGFRQHPTTLLYGFEGAWLDKA